MAQDQTDAFVEYLRNAISAAGYATATQFAREAELDPSVVLRWLGGTQRPTVRSLERVAPLLGRSTAEMVRAAYPDRVRDDGTTGAPLHHLGYEVGRLLGEDSPIPQDERKMLEKFLNTMLEPYRQTLRRRTRRRPVAEPRTSPEPATHHGRALRVAD